MKKYLLILLSVFALHVYGQNPSQRTIELNPFVGATYGLSSEAGSRKIGPSFGFEGRWNLKTCPIDIGLQAYLGQAITSYKKLDVKCRTISLTAFGDYNWNFGRNISPFIGLGIGLNQYDIVDSGWYDYKYDDNDVQGCGVVPRVGIELYRHIRITLEGNLVRKFIIQLDLLLVIHLGLGKRFNNDLKFCN